MEGNKHLRKDRRGKGVIEGEVRREAQKGGKGGEMRKKTEEVRSWS